MEDGSSSRSKLSNDSHFDIQIIGPRRDINRTFCMKQNSSRVRTGSWPDGKIYFLNVSNMPS